MFYLKTKPLADLQFCVSVKRYSTFKCKSVFYSDFKCSIALIKSSVNFVRFSDFKSYSRGTDSKGFL